MSRLFKRNHMCGELNKNNINEEVVLNGWVSKQRDLGGLIFIDLRDKTGIVQVTFNDSVPKEVVDKATSLRSEYVVGVKGIVKERASKNKNISTGDIEIIAWDLEIYSTAETPPIYIKDDDQVDDNLRLKYRYLDLRKPKMQRNLQFRHRVVKCARDYYDEQGFTEIETPMLIKPTPEGARDYLVPSRISRGSFYALPQSPQMFKQLLMVGGSDRYLQVAKCFRDEDLRADRQPEFTQIDLEMSFVDANDVIAVQEGFLKKLFKEVMSVEINTPFPRLTYDEAMSRFGSDKPDTRFGFELKDITDLVSDSSFGVFNSAIENGGIINGISIDGGSENFSRKQIDKLTQEVKQYGAKGLIWIRVTEDGFNSSIDKFFDKEALDKIADRFQSKVGDLILIVADKKKVVFDSLGFLRRHIAGIMNLLKNDDYKLLWVVDFPLFEEDEEGNLHAMHHPFTKPKEEDVHSLSTEPSKVKAEAYDIVMNGVELGGGSIRIHDNQLQQTMFQTLGLSEEEIEEKFGFLVEAFKYGAPPHGGLAFGLDRLIMLLIGESSIREVMAFPKNQNAQCMVSEAPGKATLEQLNELGIALIEK